MSYETITEDGEIIDVTASPGGALEAQTRGEIDIQIRTAKAYPRSIRVFMNAALEMATLDIETAERCFYALPRGGKTIEGPSARLGEIVASAWGHMRIDSRVTENDGRFLVAKGTAWDLQNNVAVSTEVRRRITDSRGKTYNDDMVMTTANAACSIARRNAIFAVVPNSYTRSVYEKCRQVAIGDASTLVANRSKVLAGLMRMGVTVERVFALLGIAGEEDITLERLGVLKGLGTAIREGDTTVDEAFPDPKVQQAAAAEQARGSDALKERLRQQNGNGVAKPEAAAAPRTDQTEPPDPLVTHITPPPTPSAEPQGKTADQLQREFTDRARSIGYSGKIVPLVVAILGYTPPQWDAKTWQLALDEPTDELVTVMHKLQPPAKATAVDEANDDGDDFSFGEPAGKSVDNLGAFK